MYLWEHNRHHWQAGTHENICWNLFCRALNHDCKHFYNTRSCDKQFYNTTGLHKHFYKTKSFAMKTRLRRSGPCDIRLHKSLRCAQLMQSCRQKRISASHGHCWGQVSFLKENILLFFFNFLYLLFSYHPHQSAGAVLAGWHGLCSRVSFRSRRCLDASLLVASGHCHQHQHQH